MRRRFLLSFAAAVSVAALVVASGGHLVALQAAAWVRMFADFSRTDSVVVAAGKTFDGKHPCPLCHEVIKNSAAGKSAPLSVDPSLKVGFFVVPCLAHADRPAARNFRYPANLFVPPGEVLLDPPGPVPKSGLS